MYKNRATSLTFTRRTYTRLKGVFISVIYFILLGRLAAEDLNAIPTRSRDDDKFGKIPKTAISTKLRVVFIAGLEGTGHHFFTGAFQEFYRANRNLTVPALCQVERSMFLPYSMSGSAETYEDARKNIEEEIQMVANIQEDVGHPGTVLTAQKTSRGQLASCPDRPEFSYPSGVGSEKVMQLPDVVMLAEVAESKGVDLRIIYLLRSAEEILLSTMKRHFQNSLGSAIHASKSNRSSEARFMAYVQVLLLDLAALHSSLDELEPGFIVCHRYSDVKDEAQASKISNFVCPTETLAESLRSTLLSYARGSSATSKHLMYQKVSSVIARIQRKLDVMEEQFCAS